ncbi:MAG TPA: hypothetical protein VEG64_16910 [Candidatus Sulfotelmatobacter sp.]|nr:hypothetical protein [Candidatus Sulfotelmatobacter sp.]
MEFTDNEKRFLHSEHATVGLRALCTAEQLIDLGCPAVFAKRIVERELEKRAKKLGPLFQRDTAPADELQTKIAAASLF